MRKMRKAYEGVRGADLYVEEFGDYREFLETLERRKPEEAKNTSPSDYKLTVDWNGVGSRDEAYDLLKKGWDAPVKRIVCDFDKNLAKTRERVRRRNFASVEGFAPIPAHAVMNLPNSMINQRTEAKKTKILDFIIMIDRACNVSTREIERKMSEQLAAIASLERDFGFRCRISVSFAPFSGYAREGKTNAACVLKVKDESQPFDIKRLAFPIVHSAMLRALMFRWERTLSAEDGLNSPYSKYHDGGMGTSFERWRESNKKEFSGMISGNNGKVIVLDFDSKVEDVIKKGTERR